MQALQKPFDISDIEWRVQQATIYNGKPRALLLAYITNRAIQERLDEVLGCNNWQNQYQSWKDKSQLCGISVWDDEKKQWLTKWDGADNTNIEGTKGGLSDSMKRAAVQWGIGRYLYNADKMYAVFSPNGTNSTKIKYKNQESWHKWETPKAIKFK
jgi:hypothetical protein